jgi:hypothetical protein
MISLAGSQARDCVIAATPRLCAIGGAFIAPDEASNPHMTKPSAPSNPQTLAEAHASPERNSHPIVSSHLHHRCRMCPKWRVSCQECQRGALP